MLSEYKILKDIYRNKKQFSESVKECKAYKIIDAEIRVNWKCNANCVMCGLHNYIYDSETERRDELSFNEITKVLDGIYNLGCKAVTLSGGEPTIRKDLVDIIAYASKKKMTVSLNTNAFAINEELLDKYLEAGLNNITISVLSPVEEINDRLMGKQGISNNTKKLLKYIADKNNHSQTKLHVFINNVILRDNIDSFEKYVEYFEKYSVDNISFTIASINAEWDEWTAQNESLRPTIEQIEKFKTITIPYLNENAKIENEISDPYTEDLEKNSHVIFEKKYKNCFIPWSYTIIQSNGDVIPCCYAPDEYILGNIREKGIEEIWNDKKYEEFRNTVNLGIDMKMCQSCKEYCEINNKINKAIKGENDYNGEKRI
ncbi:radical SAM protein [Eubacterium ventriosum]|jgi:radical SAM protein with 4Fe4S-binding SPASM domain|uniref:radical SAM protein n=1 Tax=Eubacterium ventriosum TaxID=39496 RepID=UPI003522FC63